jgi:hypothetical protein
MAIDDSRLPKLLFPLQSPSLDVQNPWSGRCRLPDKAFAYAGGRLQPGEPVFVWLKALPFCDLEHIGVTRIGGPPGMGRSSKRAVNDSAVNVSAQKYRRRRRYLRRQRSALQTYSTVTLPRCPCSRTSGRRRCTFCGGCSLGRGSYTCYLDAHDSVSVSPSDSREFGERARQMFLCNAYPWPRTGECDDRCYNDPGAVTFSPRVSIMPPHLCDRDELLNDGSSGGGGGDDDDDDDRDGFKPSPGNLSLPASSSSVQHNMAVDLDFGVALCWASALHEGANVMSASRIEIAFARENSLDTSVDDARIGEQCQKMTKQGDFRAATNDNTQMKKDFPSSSMRFLRRTLRGTCVISGTEVSVPQLNGSSLSGIPSVMREVIHGPCRVIVSKSEGPFSCRGQQSTPRCSPISSTNDCAEAALSLSHQGPFPQQNSCSSSSSSSSSSNSKNNTNNSEAIWPTWSSTEALQVLYVTHRTGVIVERERKVIISGLIRSSEPLLLIKSNQPPTRRMPADVLELLLAKSASSCNGKESRSGADQVQGNPVAIIVAIKRLVMLPLWFLAIGGTNYSSTRSALAEAEKGTLGVGMSLLPRGLLLSGPSGVGKTAAVQRAVKEINAAASKAVQMQRRHGRRSPLFRTVPEIMLFSVRGAEVLSLGVGNAEAELRRVFSDAFRFTSRGGANR